MLLARRVEPDRDPGVVRGRAEDVRRTGLRRDLVIGAVLDEAGANMVELAKRMPDT